MNNSERPKIKPASTRDEIKKIFEKANQHNLKAAEIIRRTRTSFPPKKLEQ